MAWLKEERPGFTVYTISIWTDPNAAASSVSFDSKINSDSVVAASNEWSRKYYDQYIAVGDLEQAKLFEPTGTRNCNPADFELRDFVEVSHAAMPLNWETKSKGKCWDRLEPLLKEIGAYAFTKADQLTLDRDLELSVNGRNDWYEFVWSRSESSR